MNPPQVASDLSWDVITLLLLSVHSVCFSVAKAVSLLIEWRTETCAGSHKLSIRNILAHPKNLTFGSLEKGHRTIPTGLKIHVELRKGEK